MAGSDQSSLMDPRFGTTLEGTLQGPAGTFVMGIFCYFGNWIGLNEAKVQLLYPTLHSDALYYSRNPSMLMTGTSYTGSARPSFINSGPYT